MRIVFVSRYLPFPGGRENFVYELSQSLKNDHDIFIITQDGMVGEGVTILPYIEEKEYLGQLINTIKPDIINSHTFYMCSPLGEICRTRQIPFVLTLHGDQFTIGDNARQEKVKKAVEVSNHVINVCQAGKVALCKNIDGLNPEKVSVIYNGINTNIFSKDYLSTQKPRDIFRRNSGLSSNKFVFLTPARMIWYKGIDFLVNVIIENATFLRAAGAFFLISTPNTSNSREEIEYMNSLLQQIKNKAVTDLIRIIFSGYEFMPYLYRITDGFILPSKSEQFPISILEAMASALPVIATDVGGVREIVENEKTGLLLKSENKNEMISAITKILKDGEIRQKLTDNAMQVISENFTIRNSAESYIKIFKTLIK